MILFDSRFRPPLPASFGRVATAAGVVAVLAAGGCSSGGAPEHTASSEDGPAGTVQFTGPWAGDIEHIYDSFDSEFGHAALADSAVSDMEFQEGMVLIQECYASAGFSVEYDQYGYETVTSLDGTGDASEVMGECAFADGGVSVLYYMMKANPENTAQETIMAECLVREGVVEPGFTGQDFTDVMGSGDLPWGPGDERVEPCLKDPLGLLSGSGE